MPVIKFSDNPGDMALLLTGYDGSTDIPSEPVPPNFGDNREYTRTKTDLWNRTLRNLLDVDMIKEGDQTKSLIVSPNPDDWTKGIFFIFSIPPLAEEATKLETARKVSIGNDPDGDVVLEEQEFDGTADISFNPVVRHSAEATKLETARNFSIVGMVSAGDQEFDGSADVELQTVLTNPQDDKVYAVKNNEFVDITASLVPPNVIYDGVLPLDPDDIGVNTFIEYTGTSPLSVELLIANTVTMFHIYAKGEAVTFTGDVIYSSSGGTVIMHGGVGTVKKLLDGTYLIFGDTAEV